MNSEEARMKRSYDEAMTAIAEDFPRLWRGIYNNCRVEGFTHTEAMHLVETHIMSNATGGVHWHTNDTDQQIRPINPPKDVE